MTRSSTGDRNNLVQKGETLVSPFLLRFNRQCLDTEHYLSRKGRLGGMPRGDRNMPAHPSAGPYPGLDFIVDRPLVARFFQLLQQGVRIRRRVGLSVDDFLRHEIGVASETVEKIQSIMLDGKPVDDIKSSLLRDGSTLALSAAMPGLVGATLRRGGAYSSFRSAITYHETEKTCTPYDGWVSVKIFNLLMALLGPDLLRTGVHVRSSDLLGFLAERAAEFRHGSSVTLNGKPIEITMLERSTALAESDHVFVTVAVGP